MLTAEYDYETDLEVQREEAYEEGERNKLIQMVIKKYEKNYSAEETADMLEEGVEEIEKIYELLRKQKGSYTAKEIYEQMK